MPDKERQLEIKKLVTEPATAKSACQPKKEKP